MAARYQVDTNGDIALVAATAKTIMNIINGANALIRLTEFSVSFDGVSATAEPVEVELCFCTQATAGTGTSHTIVQIGGPTRAVEATALRAYTAEPTVISVIKRWRVRADGGLLHVQFPLGREPEQITTADGLLIRCTAAAAVNAYGHMEFEEG
jgi:hypothetical protein